MDVHGREAGSAHVGQTSANRSANGSTPWPRAYMDFAVANAALHDLMYPPQRGPEASLVLGRAAGRGFEQFFELIGEGQRRAKYGTEPWNTSAWPSPPR
jgi:hypothetical protein